MTRGLPSMTALLGMLALAGYQNRDKIAEMLKGAGAGGAQPGSPGGLGGLLAGLGGNMTSNTLLGGGLSSLLDDFGRTVRPRPRILGSQPAPISRFSLLRSRRPSAPRCWAISRKRPACRRTRSFCAFREICLRRSTSTHRTAGCPSLIDLQPSK